MNEASITQAGGGGIRKSPTCATQSRRARVLVVGLVLAVVVAFLGLHAWAVSNYLRRVSDTRFTEHPVPVPRMQVQQGFAVDGQVWIHYALQLAEGDSWRVRHTDLDNPPTGREVHWSSGWAWWLLGWGKLRAAMTGEPLTAAVERAAVWANLPLLLAGIALLATWGGRRWGAAAVILLAVGMAGHRDFYEALYPGYPDHHGAIVVCLLGLLLGVLLMGVGWWQPTEGGRRVGLPGDEATALRAATVSAFFGAAGMWISAASLVLPLAMAGVASIGATFWLARPLATAGAQFSPAVWRRWGRVGAVSSLGFYLLEYFPSGLSCQLDTNHPLYAFVWWSGAELVAGLGAWASGAPVLRRTIIRLAVIGSGLVAIFFGGLAGKERLFMFAQPFMERLYQHVDELRSLWFNIVRDGWWSHADHAGLYLLPLGLATWLLVRRTDAATRLLLAVILPVALGMTAMGWWECRWLLTAGAAQILLLVVVAGCWHDRGRGLNGVPSLAAAVLAAAIFYLPTSYVLVRDLARVERVRDVRLIETWQLFYRDVAQRLAAESPRGRTVLLASPNASIAVSYYGNVRSVGTLYWENHAGLRRAAEIWMAGSDDEAARLIHESGITYVLVSWPDDFLAEYHDALRPDRRFESTLGYRLRAYRLPTWLRPIDYRPPAVLSHLHLRGDLYAVDFNQSPAVAGLRQGLFLRDRGELALARDHLATAATSGNADAAVELAWMLATNRDAGGRDAGRALWWAQVAVKACPADAHSREVLAAAFAENNRFAEANGAILLAIELAENAHDPGFVARLQLQFDSYQERRPWRE